MVLATQINFPTTATTATADERGTDRVAPPETHVHRVTLTNRLEDKSLKLDIFTLSDRFSDVWREVNFQRNLLQLRGYVMDHESEIECLTLPF